ncbi:MAG: tetratricopeptide repeat protein, partial [Pseudomonadota bacterium]
ERALRIKEAFYGPNHITVAITLNNLAGAYGALGDRSRQRDLLERTLCIKEAFYAPDHVEVAKTLNNLGSAYGILGDHSRARNLLKRALHIEEAFYGSDHVEIASTLNNLAVAHGALGDHSREQDLLARGLRIQEAFYGSDHVEVAGTLNNLAIAYASLGDHSRARDQWERTLPIQEAFYGSDHVEVARTLNNLANAYGALGDRSRLLDLLKRALHIEEAFYGSDHAEVARTLNNLGAAYGALGDHSRARDQWERALRIKEIFYGPNHVTVAGTLNNLANAYGDLGDHNRKRDLLKRALHIFEQSTDYGIEHPHAKIIRANLNKLSNNPVLPTIVASSSTSVTPTITTTELASFSFSEYNQQGVTYFQTKNYPAAITAFQTALRLVSAIPELTLENKTTLASLQQNLAAAFRENEQYAEAIQHFEQALTLHVGLAGTFSDAYKRSLSKKTACEDKQRSLVLHKEGIAHYKATEYAEALECFLKVYLLAKTFHTKPHTAIATAAFSIGSCYWQLTFYEEAVSYLQKAVDLRTQLLGIEHAETKKAQTRLVDCQQKQQEQFTEIPLETSTTVPF